MQYDTHRTRKQNNLISVCSSSVLLQYILFILLLLQKTCTICQMLLPNQCSFASHQRIHQHKSPYICPECGAICRSVHFQSHVTKNCLHYTRRVGYRSVPASTHAVITSLCHHFTSLFGNGSFFCFSCTFC